MPNTSRSVGRNTRGNTKGSRKTDSPATISAAIASPRCGAKRASCASSGAGATIGHAPPEMTSSSLRVLRDAWPPFRPACDASWRSTEKLRFAALTASPPLRPAADASSGFLAKLRWSPGTLLPPLRAISRCRSGVIDAKPLRDLVAAVTVSISRAPILCRRRLRNNRSCRSRSTANQATAPVYDLVERRLSDIHFG